MRSVSDQTVTELGGRWSVLTRQKFDHVELDRLLNTVNSTTGAQQRLALIKARAHRGQRGPGTRSRGDRTPTDHAPR